jgi:hypothetical protein
MARDIKTTPVVRGQDAVRFYHELEKNRNKVIDESVLKRIEVSAQYIQSLNPRKV